MYFTEDHSTVCIDFSFCSACQAHHCAEVVDACHRLHLYQDIPAFRQYLKVVNLCKWALRDHSSRGNPHDALYAKNIMDPDDFTSIAKKPFRLIKLTSQLAPLITEGKSPVRSQPGETRSSSCATSTTPSIQSQPVSYSDGLLHASQKYFWSECYDKHRLQSQR